MGLHSRTAAEKGKIVKCTIKGCAGECEPTVITHTVHQKGHVVVIDHVPAGVCDVCGNTLLKPATIRQLEALLTNAKPAQAVPLYEFA